MATLTSPGVSVSVTDESAYAAPGVGTIPMILVATGENKTDPTGSASDSIAPLEDSLPRSLSLCSFQKNFNFFRFSFFFL